MNSKPKKILKAIIIIGGIAVCLSYAFYLLAINYEKRLIKKLNDDWLSRTSLLADGEIPFIEWEEDTVTSRGFDSFVFLDKNCDDIKYLVHTTWPICWNARFWWNSRLGGDYFYTNKQCDHPDYYYKITNSSLVIRTSDKADTWIYLPAVDTQGEYYALDFDYKPLGSQYETLQVDVRLKSLANRLKFVIRHNRDIKFDMYIQSNGLSVSNDDRWRQYIKPLTLPKDKTSHIRVEVMGDYYSILINDKRIISVKVNNSSSLGDYWCLMSWNGFGAGTSCEMEIQNFKILHKK